MDFAQIILSPFVWLLTFFYNLFGSYGLALILFALVVKLILFPFSLKGKRSMIQMNMLSGKMQKLQKQYGSDRARYNEEVQKLYAKENVNPMGGCLWSFIPLLILLPLYAIIRQPLKYMMGINSQELFNAIAQVVNWNGVAVDMNWIKDAGDAFANTGYNQLWLSSLITPENVDAIKATLGEAGSRVVALNFDFLGVNLAMKPELKFWTIAGGFGLFVMPVISAVSGFVFSYISMKTNAVNTQSAQAANNASSKMMLIISPLMSLWIGFAMPAALCVYWIANNLLSMLQEFVCGKLLKKDYEKAAAAKAEQERLEKEEEKERRRIAAEERTKRIEEAKQNKGKKKKPEKKKDEEDDKIPATVKEASRVGLRQYARGRAYDPNRYGHAPTPYHEDAKAMLKEQADARELEKEADALEEVALEAAADDAIIEAIREEQAETAPVGEEADELEAEAPYAEESEETPDEPEHKD